MNKDQSGASSGWAGSASITATRSRACRTPKSTRSAPGTESRLQELGAKFGAKKLYTDYNEMLADPELDVVSITTMWDQHTEPTLAALKAGKHVFLEKPMASSVADCRAIVDAAKATDKYFMVGHIVRFNPRYWAAQARDRRGQDRQDRLDLRPAQRAGLDRRGGAAQDRPDHRRRRA